MKPEEICAHLGDEYAKQLGAVSPPIYQTSLFSRKDVNSGYSYSRMSNPTIELAEKKIAALEGAEAGRCFSSGMAAISASIMHTIQTGKHVIVPRNVYLPVRSFFESYMPKFGVEVTFVAGDDVDEIAEAIRDNTCLIYLETPVSNIFTVQDLKAVARLAKTSQLPGAGSGADSNEIATIVDNSWATPLNQNPHQFGIDIVVHSASKYLGGHSDIVAGVATGTNETMEAIRTSERALFGASMDPFNAWLLVRSLRTLPARMRVHGESALEIARHLESHPKIVRVLYPGLESHPQREIVQRQMTGYSGVLSFVPIGTPEQIHKAIRGLEYFEIGPSWGGYESLINTPGVGIDETRSREWGIPNGLVRISVGLESVEALTEDLDRMLEGIG